MPRDKVKTSILNAAAHARAKPAGAVQARAGAARTAPGRIRIVGGLWKRTPLQVIDAPGLRPTPDRVRENLFNWLGPTLQGQRALDLFAGTGALGLEALSRGAAHVHFNEPRREAAQAIETLLRRLQRPPGADWRVSQQDATHCVASLAPASLDLVFLDPPFHQGWLARILPALMPCLAPAARLYVEAEEPVAVPGLRLLRSGRAGQVHYHLFQNEPATPATHG